MPMPGRSAETRSRKSQAVGPSRARSTTSASARMARNSSGRGADSSRRYCQPLSSARFTSTCTKPESESRIAKRIEVRLPERARRNVSFTGFSQANNADVTGFLPPPGNLEQVHAGELEIRPEEFVAVAGDRPLHLTARELALLTALVQRSERIVSREELYREGWGSPTASPTARCTYTWEARTGA